jgi:hypothetical protein
MNYKKPALSGINISQLSKKRHGAECIDAFSLWLDRNFFAFD